MGNSKNDDSNATIKVETVRENEAEENTEDDRKEDGTGESNLESHLLSIGDEADAGDNFVTAEELDAIAALERRRKRKRRLESLETSKDDDKDKSRIHTERKEPVLKPKMETTKQEPAESDIGTRVNIDDNKMGKEMDVSRDQSEGNNESSNSDSDESDMFGSPSSEDEDLKKEKKSKKQKYNHSTSKKNDSDTKKTGAASRQDGFDDSEGYYKASIGETMELEILGGSNHDSDENCTLRLRVLGVIGKGVFSSVLKCSTTDTAISAATHNSDGIPTAISLTDNSGLSEQQHGLPSEVAIKCIRSNETMAKAALNEMKFLIRLRDSPGIVPLLLPSVAGQTNNINPNYVPPPIDFRGHTILAFPYLPYNLRDVLQKFGKGVGLSLTAVKNYFRQLLRAATYLQKHRVIHADIKPDNILVSADFSRVVVADFGSAFESQVHDTRGDDGDVATTSTQVGAVTQEAVTPYLVSRFYRAPEIILGLQPMTYAIDLWSLAVTAGELFLGRLLLKGANNNGMLYAMMKTLGTFSGRLIKNHLLQTKRHPLPAHFSQVQSNFVFKQETVDRVLGKAVHREVSLAGNSNFRPNLQSKLIKAKSPKDTRLQVVLFSDLLTKCMVLDPSKRISVRAALKHDFFLQQQQQ